MNDDVALTPEEVRAFAARDLRGALGWVVFGLAVLIL